MADDLEAVTAALGATSISETNAESTDSWSLFPTLHDQVSAKLAEDDLTFTFNETDDDETWVKAYDTRIMGRFRCDNSGCPTDGWASKMVAIMIRMYTDDQYNVRVFHQRCKDCNSLSRPSLNERTYVERVAYRLKKWKGLRQKRPPWNPRITDPHKGELCEGCQNGICARMMASGKVIDHEE
ncbi:hypothetical protein FDECE_3903 [Fusarium decemcellulare]|nr:hypothetical protein FDECE_3903 [Fusarium decemcellulare]